MNFKVVFIFLLYSSACFTMEHKGPILGTLEEITLENTIYWVLIKHPLEQKSEIYMINDLFQVEAIDEREYGEKTILTSALFGRCLRLSEHHIERMVDSFKSITLDRYEYNLSTFHLKTNDKILYLNLRLFHGYFVPIYLSLLMDDFYYFVIFKNQNSGSYLLVKIDLDQHPFFIDITSQVGGNDQALKIGQGENFPYLKNHKNQFFKILPPKLEKILDLSSLTQFIPIKLDNKILLARIKDEERMLEIKTLTWSFEKEKRNIFSPRVNEKIDILFFFPLPHEIILHIAQFVAYNSTWQE